MKKTLSLLSALAVGMLFCACSSGLDVNSENYIGDKADTSKEILKGVNVTIEGASYDEETRASYTVDPIQGFLASWTLGDTIGIYPVGGDQVAFPISDGEGTATAHFDGGAWALRDGRQYAAYYPFSKANSWVSETAIPVSYTGQEQDGDNSTAHLSKYDYLAAAATSPVAGSIDLHMKHLGAFVRFQLTMPEVATLASAEIESDLESFILKGEVDITEDLSISPITVDNKISLSIKNITCAKNQVVTLYTMLAPRNFKGSNFTITLTAEDGTKFVYETAGNNILAGKSYNYALSDATVIRLPKEYVDLGLSVKWATCNVGASKPEDYGYYFAWGETVGYGQDTNDGHQFKWSTYKWCSNGSWSGMTKYTYPDNQTSGIWYSGSTFIGDRKTILEKSDDAASVNWGGSWRMPTKAELDELRNISNCTWTWTTLNGVNGYKVTSKRNGNSIFLPAAGCRSNSSLGNAGSCGYFWSSSLCESGSDYAYDLRFSSSNVDCYNGTRYGGRSVRAVCQ